MLVFIKSQGSGDIAAWGIAIGVGNHFFFAVAVTCAGWLSIGMVNVVAIDLGFDFADQGERSFGCKQTLGWCGQTEPSMLRSAWRLRRRSWRLGQFNFASRLG